MPPGLIHCAYRNTVRYLFKFGNKKFSATIKADQINFLRKQYDAFLEEDKKRKERNEHILEKLDTMRLSNTVARYKSNVYLDQRMSFNCIGEVPLKTCPHLHSSQPAMVNPVGKLNETAITTELDVLNKTLHTDETYILNEISKKFILIPKLKTVVGADYIPRSIKQDNNNDSDWKRKYSILDKLKQNEKEETRSFGVLKDHDTSFLDDIPTKEHTSPRAYLDEKKKINPTIADVKKDKTNVQPEETPKLSTTSKELKTDTNNGENLQQLDLDDFGVPLHQYTYQAKDADEQLSSHYTSDRHSDGTYNDKYENEDSEKLSLVVDDIRHVEEIDPIKPEAQKTKSSNVNTGDPEKLKYPIDIINVQDFTPAEDVALVDGVNINPDHHTLQQTNLAPSDQYAVAEPAENTNSPKDNQSQQHGDIQYLNQPIDSSGQIHLPNANQPLGDNYVSEPGELVEQVYVPGDQQTLSGDHYVSEPVAVDAAQQEHIENIGQLQQQPDFDQSGDVTQQQADYDQSVDVTSEIQEFEDEQKQMFYSEQTNYQGENEVGDAYSANTNYDPALYYGDVQQQQEAAYPAEINEHEETSQRYDPSYEEQYTDQQQYSEQQYAVQQQYSEQQYDGQPLYGDQQYGDQMYVDQQQYAEQQHYTERPNEGQSQGDPGMIETLQDYDPAYTLQEQTMEQIEQQLDNEELNVASVPEGDSVNESSLYAQNAEQIATTEQHNNNENQEPVS